MGEAIQKLFEYLSLAFDKIPLLNKIKGFRFLFASVGMATCYGLMQYGVGNHEIVNAFYYGFLALAGLALNAKGRVE